MTLEEINKQIEELPSDDPEFIIGWLIAQLMYVIQENSILRHNVAEMQEQIHNFQVRIKELIEKINNYELAKYGKNY